MAQKYIVICVGSVRIGKTSFLNSAIKSILSAEVELRSKNAAFLSFSLFPEPTGGGRICSAKQICNQLLNRFVKSMGSRKEKTEFSYQRFLQQSRKTDKFSISLARNGSESILGSLDSILNLRNRKCFLRSSQNVGLCNCFTIAGTIQKYIEKSSAKRFARDSALDAQNLGWTFEQALDQMLELLEGIKPKRRYRNAVGSKKYLPCSEPITESCFVFRSAKMWPRLMQCIQTEPFKQNRVKKNNLMPLSSLKMKPNVYTVDLYDRGQLW